MCKLAQHYRTICGHSRNDITTASSAISTTHLSQEVSVCLSNRIYDHPLPYNFPCSSAFTKKSWWSCNHSDCPCNGLIGVTVDCQASDSLPETTNSYPKLFPHTLFLSVKFVVPAAGITHYKEMEQRLRKHSQYSLRPFILKRSEVSFSKRFKKNKHVTSFFIDIVGINLSRKALS